MEIVKFPSRGGFSVRSIFTFALATILVALLWTLFSNTPTHAETDVSWSGDTILYNNHGYSLAEEGSLKYPSGTIPSDATVYKTPVQTVGTGNDASQKVFIIYFSSGVDPPVATSATYVEFDYKNGTLSNPHNQKELSVTPKADQTGYSSCSVQGVGWIVCPMSVFLADAMDKIFEILSGMIETQPLVLSDPNNSMYVAWNIMRTVANIAFVIVFLLIIYSQLTNVGVSNYGIKKMIPRLIVAAVLVNVSFYVCALAIDISNILGYSIQDVFKTISDNTFHLTNDDVGGFATSPWSTVTTVILAGGGLIGGAYYMASGGLYLLMPLILGLILTIIMVVIILAARQAIIVILVIVAPLAFVANLLPNTEKWFDKWKDLFFTMLIFFPAFSFVFGASQLAGQIIIQNAGDSVIMLLFGLAVQIAPLVITPLLLRLSGNLLGKITNIVNNPRKGMIDRSRTTAQQRAELAKQRNIAQGPRFKNPASWGAPMVRNSDFKSRRLKGKTDTMTQAATNRYEESKKYNKLHEDKADVDMHKERIHNAHGAHVDHLKATPGSRLNTTAVQLEQSKLHAEGWQNQYAAHIEDLKISDSTPIGTAARFAQTSKEHVETAQHRVQTVFDAERRTTGTNLNAAHIALEEAKLLAENSKNLTARYVSNVKLNVETDLHVAHIRAEDSKLIAQVGETSLARMTEEYKTGEFTASSPELTTLMGSMANSVTELGAESQGTAAAKNIQARNFARALTETDPTTGDFTPRAEMLQQAAASVDPQGATRARAAATSQLGRNEKEALDNNIILLKSEAQNNNANILDWSRTIFKRHIGTYEDPSNKGVILPVAPQDPAILEAAMDILADDGDILVMRDALMSDKFTDEKMMTRVISRNENAMKAKGGFDIQQKMGDLWNVSREEMDFSIATTLGAVSADKISGQKWGWWNSLAPTNKADNDTSIKRIIDNVQAMPDGGDKEFAQNMLQSFYSNLTTALTSPEIMSQIGDRNEQTAKMHRILQETPGLIADRVTLDYELSKRGLANPAPKK